MTKSIASGIDMMIGSPSKFQQQANKKGKFKGTRRSLLKMTSAEKLYNIKSCFSGVEFGAMTPHINDFVKTNEIA